MSCFLAGGMASGADDSMNGTVEAMSSHRPCLPALGSDKALAEIEQHRGARYATAVAGACVIASCAHRPVSDRMPVTWGMKP